MKAGRLLKVTTNACLSLRGRKLGYHGGGDTCGQVTRPNAQKKVVELEPLIMNHRREGDNGYKRDRAKQNRMRLVTHRGGWGQREGWGVWPWGRQSEG